jgi:tryptophan-rich sensory protein
MSKQKKIYQKPNQECEPSKMNLLLADAIFVFHCLIVLFVLFAPFTNIPAILILHITFAWCLMVHWHANSNVCSLSIIESQLRGLDSREDTFTHKFIAPMYDISLTEWSNIVWYITFIVMCISIYKLYNTEKFKNAWKCYSELDAQPTLGDKIAQLMACFKPLFIMD